MTCDMLFSNQKIFLDVKDYGKIDQLEADICQFGGTVEKFLSKEITCVVTNRTRTEHLLTHKDVSAPASNQSQSLRPGACASRVMSRGQSLLMRSNSLKDKPVCDPVTFAQTWGIKIVSLDTVVQAVDKHRFNPSSPVTKQPLESHLDMKRRKFSDTAVKVGNAESKLTKFSDAFVKFEDTESNFRPFFHQYSTFPRLDLEGDLSNGIFKCGENVRPVVVRKNVGTPASARKQKVWSKRGYCECCDVMYEDLNEHLISADHQRFVEHFENFADLDKLIDEISLSDGSAVLLPAGDNCTHAACETAFTEGADDVQLTNSSSMSRVSVESNHVQQNAHIRQNNSHDCQRKPEESDKIVNAVENSPENHNTSPVEIDKHSRSLVHVSLSGMDTFPVNSRNCCADDVVEKVSVTLHSQTLPVCCDGAKVSSTFDAISQSVDSCKADGTSHKEKLCSISVDGDQGHADDMPEFISSSYVVNLLELLSSENSANLTLHADEATYCTTEVCENQTSVQLVNSLALHGMPTACGYDTVCAEVRPNDKEHCERTTATEGHLLLTSMQNDLLDRFGTAVTIGHHNTDIDRSTTENEHMSKSVTLPAVSLSYLPTLSSSETTALSETSHITNDSRTYSDSRSCDMQIDSDASILPLCEVQTNCLFLPSLQPSVDQPTVCANEYVPFYANRQVSSVCAFGDRTFSSFPSSDVINDGFYLHSKLLSMAYELDAAEQNKQQTCSSAQTSYPCAPNCVDVSTSNNANDNNNNDLCLPMAAIPTLRFSESSVPPSDSRDTGLCTADHHGGCNESFESCAIFATDDVSTKVTPLCQNSPLHGVISLQGSGYVNDSLLSSVRCTDLQRDNEVNVVSDRNEDACLVQEKEDLQVNCCRHHTFETAVKSDVTAKLEDCHKSSSPDHTAQLETRLLVDDSSYCIKSSDNVSSFPVSTHSALSLMPVTDGKASVLAHESCDTVEQREQESDTDNDSASTMIYSFDCTPPSFLQQVNDRLSLNDNESETNADSEKPPASNADSMWKVISFADCRMRLVRTEACLPALPAQDKTKLSNKPSSLWPELHDDTTKAVDEIDVNTDRISVMLYSCDCLTSSVLEHASDVLKREHEAVGEPSVCSTDSPWTVISFDDCRMRLVRSEAAFPALKNSCSQGFNFVLSETSDDVLTYL